MKIITKIILTANAIVTTLMTYYTFFKIDGGVEIFKTMDWKALIIAIAAGGFVAWLHICIVIIVKAETKGIVKKVEERYKAYSDAFSAWFIYTSFISKIVHAKTISTMTDDELAKIFLGEDFLVKNLEKYGFPKETKDQIMIMYHQQEIDNLNHELNRDQQQVSDRT